MISLLIPKPPSVNSLFSDRRRGGRVVGRTKSKRYRAWIAEATAAILSLPRDQRAPVSGPYRLRLEIGRRKGSDLDNFLKAASDLAVSLRLIDDDRHCASLIAVWADDLRHNQARLVIAPAIIPEQAPPYPAGAPQRAGRSNTGRMSDAADKPNHGSVNAAKRARAGAGKPAPVSRGSQIVMVQGKRVAITADASRVIQQIRSGQGCNPPVSEDTRAAMISAGLARDVFGLLMLTPEGHDAFEQITSRQIGASI